MPKIHIATCLCIIFVVTAVLFPAWCVATYDASARWSARVHDENSIVASLLYLPYMVALPFVWLVDGVINPVPTTQSTMPPQGHKPQH